MPNRVSTEWADAFANTGKGTWSSWAGWLDTTRTSYWDWLLFDRVHRYKGYEQHMAVLK